MYFVFAFITFLFLLCTVIALKPVCLFGSANDIFVHFSYVLCLLVVFDFYLFLLRRIASYFIILDFFINGLCTFPAL